MNCLLCEFYREFKVNHRRNEEILISYVQNDAYQNLNFTAILAKESHAESTTKKAPFQQLLNFLLYQTSRAECQQANQSKRHFN
ncbi:hypothetical protein EA848_17780 [Vibrio anguillarum]|nr:hypothetical protein [Vibrio anguillarum]MBF4395070.1 hypothetical protein [Vibrio anguillarum]MBF4431420.1 hypothetical protein [Vibrio anguillarum]